MIKGASLNSIHCAMEVALTEDESLVMVSALWFGKKEVQCWHQLDDEDFVECSAELA